MKEVIEYIKKCEKENALKDRLIETQSQMIKKLEDKINYFQDLSSRYEKLSDDLIVQVNTLSDKLNENEEYTNFIEVELRKCLFHTVELVESNN